MNAKDIEEDITTQGAMPMETEENVLRQLGKLKKDKTGRLAL